MARLIEFDVEKNKRSVFISDLNKLIDLLNRQDTIQKIKYSKEENKIEYKYTYGIGKNYYKSILIPDSLQNDESINELIESILIKYDLLKNKIDSNIEKNYIEEYITMLSKTKKIPAIPAEINGYKLLQEIINRKEEIISEIDYDSIYGNAGATAVFNMIISAILILIDRKIGSCMIAYTALSTLAYTALPIKLDGLKNKRKYNSLVKILNDSKDELKPNLNFLCMVQDYIFELENKKGIDLSLEIFELRKLSNDYYLENKDNQMDIDYLDKFIKLITKVEDKEKRMKLTNITEYRNRREERELIKLYK